MLSGDLKSDTRRGTPSSPDEAADTRSGFNLDSPLALSGSARPDRIGDWLSIPPQETPAVISVEVAQVIPRRVLLLQIRAELKQSLVKKLMLLDGVETYRHKVFTAPLQLKRPRLAELGKPIDDIAVAQTVVVSICPA